MNPFRTASRLLNSDHENSKLRLSEKQGILNNATVKQHQAVQISGFRFSIKVSYQKRSLQSRLDQALQPIPPWDIYFHLLS